MHFGAKADIIRGERTKKEYEMLLQSYTVKDYFLLDTYYFFDNALHFYINIFVLLLGVAISACCFIVTAYTRSSFTVYTQLLRHKALDEESAKTLDQLHLKPTGTIKHTLLRSNHFNKCIRRAGVDAENNPSARSEKIDFTKERFYIDTSVKLKSTEPPSYTSAIITSAIIIVVSVILFWCMPDILELISGVNMLGTK